MTKKSLPYISELLIALAAMSGCFFYLLNRTWMKWGDLLIDTFREFWVPMKILEGHVLYRDVFYTYGFFPPYFQALLFKCFGLHLHTLVGLGIAVTLVVAIALYLISRLFLSISASALTVIVFFLVFAFNHYFYNNSFNFILPYSFASTLFLLFMLYALLFFLQFIQSGRHLHLFFWALCMSMAAFCRVELPLLVWFGFLVSSFFYAIKNRKAVNLKLWSYLFLPVVVSLTGYGLFAITFNAWDAFKESVISPMLYLHSDPFQALVMGTDNTAASLETIGLSAILTISAFFMIGLSAAGVAHFAKPPRSFFGILMAIFCVLGISIIFIVTPAYFERIQYHCILLFLAAGIVFYACRILTDRHDNPMRLQMFCIFLTALLVASRMLLNMGPELYGFYLLVPGLLCYHLIIFKVLIPFLARTLPSTPKFFLNALLISFLLLVAMNYWDWSKRYYANRTARLATNRGTIDWPNDYQVKCIFQSVIWLRQNLSSEASVVVFPEGVGINFFAEKKNPLKYCNFMPPVMEYIGEDKIIRAVADNNIDYVVVVARGAVDYGYPFFGVHYAIKLSNWIKGNYHLKKVIGAMPFESERFGIAVYERN